MTTDPASQRGSASSVGDVPLAGGDGVAVGPGGFAVAVGDGADVRDDGEGDGTGDAVGLALGRLGDAQPTSAATDAATTAVQVCLTATPVGVVVPTPAA